MAGPLGAPVHMLLLLLLLPLLEIRVSESRRSEPGP